MDLQASIYGFCGSETLYNRFQELLSDEGLAQLVSRSFFGVIFEFSDHYKYVRDASINSFCRSYHAAKMFSVLLNFSVN